MFSKLDTFIEYVLITVLFLILSTICWFDLSRQVTADLHEIVFFYELDLMVFAYHKKNPYDFLKGSVQC